MKISALRISGFRGIPPVDPPVVNLTFATKDQEPKDILLFGPNAYGKSSIADALEWFFRETVRGNATFDDYEETDNVHILLGQPKLSTEQSKETLGEESGEQFYPDTAYIELDILHNGKVHTIKKEIDRTGKRVNEVQSPIADELQNCADEIIILDHDKFRSFVAAANKDKWQTFSSLIGYEELDFFREGMNSAITTKSLTDYLNKPKLEAEFKKAKEEFSKELQKLATTHEVKSGSKATFDEVKKHFWTLFEVNLQSIHKEKPNEAELSPEYWDALKKSIRTPDSLKEISARHGNLKTQLSILTPFDTQFVKRLEDLRKKVSDLGKQKQNFDKNVLAELYNKGLQVITDGKSVADFCPLCGTEFKWHDLRLHIESIQKQLNFGIINTQSKLVLSEWVVVKTTISRRASLGGDSSPSNIREAYNQIFNSMSSVDTSLELSSFDEAIAVQWFDLAIALCGDLSKTCAVVQAEEKEAADALSTSPILETQDSIAILEEYWNDVCSLDVKLQEIIKRNKYLEVSGKIVNDLRSIADGFREELSNFSGLVADLITDDVQNYYDELHPDDDVKPFLKTRVSGQQRIVELKCHYKKFPNKNAASLLSESHRNSLGLAVMLAFMKYKRKDGSPIQFIVFDDITQSFDTGHRANLLNLLQNQKYRDIYESQFIFLTHDRTLADYIIRPGEQTKKNDWKRFDIEEWQLTDMRIVPSKEDLFKRAEAHLKSNDFLAAAIYGRHALEFILKSIAQKVSLRLRYNPKPWTYKIEDYIDALLEELNKDWKQEITLKGTKYPQGIIDPVVIDSPKLRQAVRILNLTVHDSDFLENPPSPADIKTAINVMLEIRDKFTCPNCRANERYEFLESFLKDKQQGKPPICGFCKQDYPVDIPVSV